MLTLCPLNAFTAVLSTSELSTFVFLNVFSLNVRFFDVFSSKEEA